MPVTRRQFIKRGAGMVTVGIVIPRLWLSDARGEQLEFTPKRKLVVIQLAGGNDGLNTVVPYTVLQPAADARLQRHGAQDPGRSLDDHFKSVRTASGNGRDQAAL